MCALHLSSPSVGLGEALRGGAALRVDAACACASTAQQGAALSLRVILPGNMGEHEEARLRIISEGAVPGMIKFLKEEHRENSLEEELMCLEAIYSLSQHQKNHMRMVPRPLVFPPLHICLLPPSACLVSVWVISCAALCELNSYARLCMQASAMMRHDGGAGAGQHTACAF